MKVLIIGNGIAGMSAAIEAAELDDEVILVSPVQSERTPVSYTHLNSDSIASYKWEICWS